MAVQNNSIIGIYSLHLSVTETTLPPIPPGILAEIQKRNVDLERELGALVAAASEGTINSNELYQKSMAFRYERAIYYADGWDSPLANLLLKEALEEIELLHDANARISLNGLKAQLLGQRECTFIRTLDEATYHITYCPSTHKLPKLVEASILPPP